MVFEARVVRPQQLGGRLRLRRVPRCRVVGALRLALREDEDRALRRRRQPRREFFGALVAPLGQQRARRPPEDDAAPRRLRREQPLLIVCGALGISTHLLVLADGEDGRRTLALGVEAHRVLQVGLLAAG